jgi:hypothetical protein
MADGGAEQMTNPQLEGDEDIEPHDLNSRVAEERKVVVKLRSGEVVKGYVTVPGVHVADPFCDPEQNCKAVTVRLLHSSAPMEIPLIDVKAVFFVKSFRGDPKRKGLRFYSNGPAVGTIWAEIRFTDDEVIEATIENSVQHLMGGGFWFHPSDGESNNVLIYVNKSAIATYRVLGVRAHRESDKE